MPESEKGGIPPARPKGIALLTPSLGRVTMLWSRRLMDIVWPMNTMKSVFYAKDKKGGEVGEMRNGLTKKVLDIHESGNVNVSHILWLDDDVVPCSPLIMQALLQHDTPIAAGVYFCKGEFPHPLIFPGGTAGHTEFRPNEVFESWGYAQGLSLVQIEVFQRMRDELEIGEDKYGNPAWYKQPDFSADHNGMTLGGTEDFVFFANASKLGYRPVVDCSAHAFGFHVDLESGGEIGFPKQQYEMWLRQEPIVWPKKGDREEVIWQ